MKKPPFDKVPIRNLQALQSLLLPIFKKSSDLFWNFSAFMAQLRDEIERRRTS
jgi:hypothetical protein